MALRFISCSPRSGRARCHRRRRNCFHRLDASIGASGPHDFTVRIRTIRQGRIRVHRIPSRACDDRETPLVPGRDESGILLIWVSRQDNFGKSEVSRRDRGHRVRSRGSKSGARLSARSLRRPTRTPGQIGVRSNSSARRPASDPRSRIAGRASNKCDVAVSCLHSIIAKD